ncbi:MAG: biotin--[acetyl-CoA-carboxylase] ligase [Rhizobiales bacterium]|nr:biotin--[acetyl-CoA-carboxylase] ligase [Hyphomicrobiales bacterium]
MAFSLGREAAARSYRLEAHDTVGSTNALALEHARAGDPGLLWIVARKQESGRGRRGRVWETPHGNLAATLLVAGRYELKRAATLGFVAGLALAEALASVAPGAAVSMAADGASGPAGRFELKWPNDVLFDGAKLAGILLESHLSGDGRVALAIGIGVNVVAHPEDVPYPATSLAALGASCDAETLFAALSDAWAGYFEIWNGGEGLSAIRKLWLARAAGLGGEVAVTVDGAVKRGIFETIDEDGRFVIRARDGTAVAIAAGDVHFGAVASARAGI